MKIGYAVVDLQSGEKLISQGDLPVRVTLPDGGFSQFASVGQVEPGHAPRYKCVEQIVVTQAPSYPHIVISETNAFVDEQDQVSRTYAPDQAAYQRAIENHIEAAATSRGYSSTVSLASYVTSTIPQWKAEADAFTAWRDAVWSYVFTELAKAQAGERAIPSLEEFITELPVIEW